MDKIFKLILKFIEELFPKPEPSNDNKVMCKYLEIYKNEARGIMYFRGTKTAFISGRYGKGRAPVGTYRCYKLIHETRGAFCQHGLGWQVPMEAKFETERFGLAIHPDGNIEGTLGCIGLSFDSLEENVIVKNLFRDHFEISNELEVLIC